MTTADRDAFLAGYAAGRPQVVVRRLIDDLETPVSAFLKVGHGRPYACLLESVEGGAVNGRYSIVALDPDIVWRCRDGRAETARGPAIAGAAFTPEALPALESLRALIAASRFDLPEGLPPMAAGLFGVFGYDMVRLLEPLGAANPDPLDLPDAVLGRPSLVAVFDSVEHEIVLVGLFAAEAVFAAGIAAGALSVDALKGSDAPFDPRIHALRGQPGQIAVAATLRELMAGSAIRDSHRDDCSKVQDPYSLRCQPQVMGAALDVLKAAAATLEREANAVTDNPLVLIDDGDVISGGNFHAEPVAFAADMIAMAICEIGSIAERRIAMLVDPALSGLPAFLTPHPGLNSGFMIPQVTAAALVSENKQRAYPASVDSIPTSANQEDHVSMAAHGARRLLDMAENASAIVAIELLAAAQGCDFHAPLPSSVPLEAARACLRRQVPMLDHDRYFHPDMEAANAIVRSGELIAAAAIELPGLD